MSKYSHLLLSLACFTTITTYTMSEPSDCRFSPERIAPDERSPEMSDLALQAYYARVVQLPIAHMQKYTGLKDPWASQVYTSCLELTTNPKQVIVDIRVRRTLYKLGLTSITGSMSPITREAIIRYVLKP